MTKRGSSSVDVVVVKSGRDVDSSSSSCEGLRKHGRGRRNGVSRPATVRGTRRGCRYDWRCWKGLCKQAGWFVVIQSFDAKIRSFESINADVVYVSAHVYLKILAMASDNFIWAFVR